MNNDTFNIENEKKASLPITQRSRFNSMKSEGMKGFSSAHTSMSREAMRQPGQLR